MNRKIAQIHALFLIAENALSVEEFMSCDHKCRINSLVIKSILVIAEMFFY